MCLVRWTAWYSLPVFSWLSREIQWFIQPPPPSLYHVPLRECCPVILKTHSVHYCQSFFIHLSSLFLFVLRSRQGISQSPHQFIWISFRAERPSSFIESLFVYICVMVLFIYSAFVLPLSFPRKSTLRRKKIQAMAIMFTAFLEIILSRRRGRCWDLRRLL